jgi:copper oxidase (laccase) domain-containing protein
MLAAGVPDDHIDMADTCTFAHDELYFSHRRQGMTRGGQAALLMMKE